MMVVCSLVVLFGLKVVVCFSCVCLMLMVMWWIVCWCCSRFCWWCCCVCRCVLVCWVLN